MPTADSGSGNGFANGSVAEEKHEAAAKPAAATAAPAAAKAAGVDVGTLSETLDMIRGQMEREVKAQNEHDHKVEGKDAKKAASEEEAIALTPQQRAMKFYERAKALYTRGGGSSLELEIIIRDVALASNFAGEDPRMFYFLAKVFRQQLDFNSSIYALRNVLRMDAQNRAACVMLGDVLFRRAQEVMGDAAIMDRQVQTNARLQAEAWRHYLADKAEAEEKLAKQEAYTRQRKSALAIANKLRGTPAAGTIHVPPDVAFELVELPPRPILLRVPKRVQEFVAEQYRLACGLFNECLEYDRDNYKSLMSKAVCHAYAEEFTVAAEVSTRAIHLAHVRLKDLCPSNKAAGSSAQSIRNSNRGSGEGGAMTMEKETESAGDPAVAAAADMTDDLTANSGLPPPTASHLTPQIIYYSEYTMYPTDEVAAEVLKLSRQVGEMLIMRGKCYGAVGLTEKGNGDMRKANSVIPEHPECVKFGVRSYVRAEKIYNVCMRKFKAGDLEEALALILMACSLSSTDIKLQIMQARIYRATEELEKAYQAIQRATELYQGQSEFEMRVPEDVVKETNMIYNDIALQCAAKGQYEKAILLLNKVISAEAQLARGVQDIDYRFYINRGDCLRAKRQYEAALGDYNTAMECLVSTKMGASSGLEGARRQWVISTRLSITYYNVACDHFNESAFADAERHLTNAIENNPKVAEYFLTRGKARYYSGSYQHAYEDFKQTLVIDPQNEEAKKRLKQFANLGMGVGEAEDLPEGKEEPAGMTLAEAKRSRGSITPIETTKEDLVEAILHPRSSKKLPDITMRSGSAGSGATRAVPLLPSKDARVVSSTMLMPALASVSMRKAEQKLHAVLDAKPDTTKSVNWTMFANAKKMAYARSRPPIDRKKQCEMRGNLDAEPALDSNSDDVELESVTSNGGTKRRLPKSYTTSGLKRYSQKQTSKALKKGGLIAGVITHSMDPYLAGAEEGEGKQAGKAFTIDVTARPRVNKFAAKKAVVEAGGEVQTFEATDAMANLASDTTSWREKMRRDNETKSSQGVDLDLLASLTGGGASSFFDNPATGAGGYKTKQQLEEEAVALRAAAKAERKLLRKQRKAEIRAAQEVAALRRASSALAEGSDENGGGGGGGLKIGEIDEHGEIFLGDEFSAPAEGETEEEWQLRREKAAAFLNQQQKDSGIAKLLGGSLNFGSFGASLHEDDENVSSLIALTEEQELQLAYEERIKAEHEEARQKKQDKLKEKLMEQRSFNKLLDDHRDDSSDDEQ